MNLVRCDGCKKLNDEPGIGYIGKEHKVSYYRETKLIIRVIGRDLCRECVKKEVDTHSFSEAEEEL